MKTKIIPFDLKTAKKIQAGEIKGVIKTRGGVKIHEFFSFSSVAVGAYGIYATIDGLVHSYRYDGFERNWDRSGRWGGDLVLEVPEDEPQFKPFDRVLVRNEDTTSWTCAIFSHMSNTAKYVANCFLWKQCIPYEGNQELVGTTDNPKED